MSEQQRPERPNRKSNRPGGGNGGGGPGGAGGGGGLKFGRGVFGWVLFIGLAVMLFMLLNQNGQNFRDVSLNDLLHQLENGKVKEMVIDGAEAQGTFTEPFADSGGSSITKFKTTVSAGTVPEWFYM